MKNKADSRLQLSFIRCGAMENTGFLCILGTKYLIYKLKRVYTIIERVGVKWSHDLRPQSENSSADG